MTEQNKANNDNAQNASVSDSQNNPMKAVTTTSHPTKYEFSSDQSQKNAEKRNKQD